MRPILLFLLTTLLSLQSVAQNHVLNGDFEKYITCPPAISCVQGYCDNWYPYTAGTPDYYNACDPWPDPTMSVSVPTNGMGYEPAASGQAYGGLIVYDETFIQYWQWSEYLTGAMKPLVPGKSYEVSISLSLAEISKIATGDFGVLFTCKRGYYWKDATPVKVTPHVSYANYGIIKNNTGWVRLTGTFVADSAYEYIVVGVFTDTPKRVSVTAKRESSVKYAYYYLDSVTVKYNGPPEPPEPVKPQPIAAIGNIDSVYCTGASLVFPYKVTGARFNSANEFTVRLQHTNGKEVRLPAYRSDTSGIISLQIPPDMPAGKYEVWLISTSPADTFYYNGYIRLYNHPKLKVSVNNVYCNGSIELHAVAEGTDNVYWSGPNSFYTMGLHPVINNAFTEHSGSYYAIARSGPCAVSDSVSVKLDCAEIQVPTAFSPNGDGVNDILYFYGTDNVRELLFSIYNRWGQVIYETTDPKAGWDGRYKGALVDTDLVVYILRAVDKNGKIINRSGSITIIH